MGSAQLADGSDVIESLDPDLFERVTGLKISDFKLLSALGLFHARNLDAAIWQFRQFERTSLRYADTEPDAVEPIGKVGLMETTVGSHAETPGKA